MREDLKKEITEACTTIDVSHVLIVSGFLLKRIHAVEQTREKTESFIILSKKQCHYGFDFLSKLTVVRKKLAYLISSRS